MSILSSILQFIRSEVERVTGIVAQQRQITSGILDTIKSYVPKIQSAWIGGDADAFAADVGRKVVPAMLELIAAIGGININLSKSVDIIDRADHETQRLASGVKDVFSKDLLTHKRKRRADSMAKQIVQMDYAVVTDVSRGFANASSMLKTVEKVLVVAIGTLRTLALVSAGTSAALARYLETIRQKVKHLAEVCDEFSGDLARAVGDHQKGDIQGKRYFGEGVRS